MAANNETKVQKSNTLEQWRVATNTVSHHVGDVDLLDTRLTDGLFLFTGDGTTTRFGFGLDNSSKSLRIELQPENPVDSIAQILLTGSPNITGFAADVVVFQGSVGSETFTGTINYINANRIVLRNITGTFDASADLKYASNTIGNANLVRLISESYDTGYAKVQVDGNTQVQEVGVGSQAGYHILNYSLEVVLSGSPSIPTEFTEGAVLTQAGGFVGTILEVSTTHLRFKTHNGTFATNTLVQLQGDASKRILAANLSSVTAKDTAIGSVIEFHTAPGSGKSISINTQNLVDSITEVQDDVGNITNLGTSDKVDVVSAINEIENAARAGNSDYSLGTNAQNFRDAINELETAARGANSTYTLLTTGQNFKEGINELETAVRGTHTSYTLGTDADNLIQAVNELETAVRGGGVNYTLGTTATNIIAGINELETAARGPNSSYGLTTTKQNFKEAINELDGEIGTISTFSGLASDVSAALVQLHTEIGDVSASNMGTTASNVTSAIFELEQEIDTLNTNHLNKNLAGNVNQNITGSITFTGDSVDFSNTTALFSAAGGVANFGSAFVNLNATAASGSNVALQGLQVDRTAISGGASTHDVRLIWNEGSVAGKPHKAWELRGMNNSGADHTAEIVTFYNAYELVANNTESGINVTWDSGNNNFDFNVNDPTLTFTSSTFRSSGNLGQATITNLGNTTFALTANTLDLGYSEHIRLGGSDEFQIFNDNTNSVISSTDNLHVRTNIFRLNNAANSENMITADNGGAVNLFHNGNSKLQTTSVGIGVTGAVIASGEIEGTLLDINGAADISGNLVVHGNTTLGDQSSDTVSVPGNMTITGDLTVNGTNTILNTSTLEVEDTLILTGTSSTEPATGGFGIETRLFTGTQTPSGSAANVTGTHSFVYNFAANGGQGEWQADGVRILDDVNSIIVPELKINNGTPVGFNGSRDLNFLNGTGITVSGGLSGNNFNVQFTHDRLAPNEMIYKQFAADSGAMAVANNNNDTLTIRGGSSLTSVSSGTTQDIITINHDVTGAASVNNSGGTVIQDLTINTNGHVTATGSVNLDTRYAAIGNTVNLSGNQSISGTKTFSSQISGSISGQAGSISGQANSATITASTGATANQIALRNGAGDLYAVRFRGNGDSLTNLNASQLTSGTIPAARVPTLNQNTTGSSASCTGQANTIASQANSATINATSSNSGNQIVLRNASGNFSAGTITASLTGNVSGNVTGSSGSCTGNASTATSVYVTGSQGSANYRVVFANYTGNGSGNRGLLLDSGGNLYYNASNNIMYAGGFSGTHYGTWAGSAIAYSSLSGTPTVGNGTITISQTGRSNQTFTVNQSGNTTITLNDNNTTYTRASFINQSVDTGANVHFEGLMVGQASGATANTIRCVGDIVASYSDDRLKDRIGNIENALEKVNSLNGFTYTPNQTAVDLGVDESSDKVKIGVSAQEVKAVLPEAVTDAPVFNYAGYQTVQYDKMVPLLIEAIKELTEQNKELKAEIENLKSINS